MWIDGKCFDIRRVPERGKKSEADETSQKNVRYEIKTNDQGKLFTSFRLPRAYCAKLSKCRRLDLKTLEGSTSTHISIPTSGNLVITGESEEKIVEARDEIHAMLGDLRDQTVALQFVSIPTLSTEIVENFTKFKDNILGDEIEGMHESIFQSPLKLHLTVVVFALMDDHEKLEATKALQDYKNMILDPLIRKAGPAKIKISGIDCMNRNLKKVDILFANATIVNENEEFNLQQLVNGLSDHFYERGLVRKYQDNVKLHMTLINTKYRKIPDSPKKKRWGKRQSVDATKIMEKYKDFYFGECDLNSIHLSLIGSVGSDGFYEPISIINAP